MVRSPASHSSNTGAIVGGVVGGVAALALVLGTAGFLLLRKRRLSKADPEAVNTIDTDTPKNYFDSDLQVLSMPWLLLFSFPLFRLWSMADPEGGIANVEAEDG